MMKRMMGVNKRTHTTNLLYALDIEPVELKLKKIKTTFARRLLEKSYTHGLVDSIANKELNDNKFKIINLFWYQFLVHHWIIKEKGSNNKKSWPTQ